MVKILDGKLLANALLQELRSRAEKCKQKGEEPCLAVVLVGEDPASQVYVRSKQRRAAEVGILTCDHRLPVTTSTSQLLDVVGSLNQDPKIHGILIQLPLPESIDSDRVLFSVNPEKDVDGFHPENLGRLMIGKPRFVACTPLGCMRLLESSGVPIAGKRAIVVGRSNIVGKPVAQLLMHANATVTVAHSQTAELAKRVGEAEIVVAAIGRPEFVKGKWIKEGAVVIDVGINRIADGRLVGDVEGEIAAQRAHAITPVPGGVGPMTIACLLDNTLVAAERRLGGPREKV